MNARICFAVAATALIAGGLGFLAGKNYQDPREQSAVSTSSSEPQDASRRPWNDTPDSPASDPGSAESSRGKGLATRPPTSIEAEPERKAGRETLHRMLEQPGPISRWQDLMDFAQTATPDQISGALDELINVPSSIDTVVARFFLYSRFGEGDPEAALAAIEGLPQGEIDLAKQSVLGGWAGKDPEAAAAYLLEQAGPDGELDGLSGRLVRNVVAEWSRRNPAEGFQWSLGLKGEGRETGIKTALRIWASVAPEAAAEAIAPLPAGEEREDAYRTLAEHWSQAEPMAAMTWAADLSDDVKSIVTATAVKNLAKMEPVQAAGMIAELEPGDDRDWAMRSAASNWAETQPGAAADWAWSQPENEARRKAVRDVVRKWAGEDEGAASAWLDQQEPGPAKDSGIVALSNNVVADDPEAAAIWANTIGDPALRSIQVRGVVRTWMKEDRGAAFNWLQGADVLDSVKAEFFQQ